MQLLACWAFLSVVVVTLPSSGPDHANPPPIPLCAAYHQPASLRPQLHFLATATGAAGPLPRCAAQLGRACVHPAPRAEHAAEQQCACRVAACPRQAAIWLANPCLCRGRASERSAGVAHVRSLPVTSFAWPSIILFRSLPPAGSWYVDGEEEKLPDMLAASPVLLPNSSADRA